MLALIDRERDRLHRFARLWGMHDSRTLRQSEKLDRLVYVFMRASQKTNIR